ncbi:RNA-binding protein [Blumeria hordei DH14]|uniref:U4/U6 snRNA-associated-splicing factor PRP24 n=1 Tax=Blumeria graminis f. sp. hordei (strain DH14) TaxID=546991 RepID=N1JIB2_BLUG1|nr:RNA-binding protein [Blumeria hordei DH14]
MSDPVGEDGWLALVDEASRTAGDLERRIEVVELYKRAIAAEPSSNKLWLAYCEWVWSLYKDCQNSDAGWPVEEQLLGQEIFSWEMALEVWLQGAQATQYRLNDSHVLWNRWISIELEKLSEDPNPQDITRVKQLFFDRLQTPHAAWDDTSQNFSNFLTKYCESTWESSMVEVTKLSANAKEQYKLREAFELKLQKAVGSSNNEDVKSQILDYLNWEQGQVLKQSKKGMLSISLLLCVALFERALTSTPLSLDPSVWEDYVVFLLSTKVEVSEISLPPVLSIIQRGTNHCPWSGALWARYILCAEAECLPFSTMEQIKHAATNARDLDRDGMNDVVEFYIAWCGYLKRRTMVEGATDEDLDVAEMGLPTALEDVLQWGRRRCGKGWNGDPFFRIETILIQHLTQKRAYEEARRHWRSLVPVHADNYEFWQQYYMWEMNIRNPSMPPTYATAVLVQAINRKSLDWPEKIIEIYVRHCNNCEEVATVIHSLNTVRRISKGIAKRREREAVAYQAQSVKETEMTEKVPNTERITEDSKRKREDGEYSDSVSKKAKLVSEETWKEQYLKRDRENTTIIVSNLPVSVTQTKLRQYFNDYAHINNITLKADPDGLSTTALIELRSRVDVSSAIIKHNKYFGDRQISVTPGTGLTLYVTNYPPAADDAYFYELFKDCGEILSIRWPSIKYKTSRRFVYITFRSHEGAAAATKLDGLSLDGFYKLTAAYSNPSNKKDREGATAEGREVHVKNLDLSLTEKDIKEVFSKYGTVQRVNVLKKLTGESKGVAFISYSKQEEANASLELDKTKLKSCILSVEISKEKNFKPTATTVGNKLPTLSMSDEIAKSGNLTSSMLESGDSYEQIRHNSLRSEISNRTIALLNIPDTINDSRIRLLASSYGEIIKIILRPDHQGAIIEYTDAVSAGKASLGLENYEIIPGHKIHMGSLKDLFSDKRETRVDSMQAGNRKNLLGSFMKPTAPIKRPMASRKNRFYQKKKVDSSSQPNLSTPVDTDVTDEIHINNNTSKKLKEKLTNSDFKALYSNDGR